MIVENSFCPSKIRLEASSHCQLACPVCPTAQGLVEKNIGVGFLKFVDFKKIIDDNIGVYSIELSNYGEVFLNPEIEKIFQYAYQKNVGLKISNGANFNNVRPEVLEALVKYKVWSIRVSLDGTSPKVYSLYRIRGNFQQVIDNVKTVIAYKRKYHSIFPCMTWQMIAFGHNEHQIQMAKQMARSLGMDFDLKLNWDSQFSPVRDVERIRKESRSGASSMEDYFEKFGTDYGEYCRLLWQRPQIHNDGKILGCCVNFWGDFGTNAFSEGLENSLNGEKLRYAKQMLKGQVPSRQDIPCTTCSVYHHRFTRGHWIRAGFGRSGRIQRFLFSHGFGRMLVWIINKINIRL